jgi:transcriptional regulator with XRE-family HTH domain
VTEGGERSLRARRMEAGWSQGDLARAAASSISTISDLERGKVPGSPRLWARIEAALREREAGGGR